MADWKDDEWDEQMKRDIASGKLDSILREVEGDIKAGRVHGRSLTVLNYRAQPPGPWVAAP